MLRYEAGYANDIWCADSSHGPYLYIDNQKIKLYIIAFIDDASRMITGCKIYDSDNVVNLMATLKSAIATYGKPKVLNMDNGRNYRSKQMSIIAAKCGISLHYDPVKTPTSKAKIERFFKTLKEHWMASIDYHNFKSIDEYQTSLNDYIRNILNLISKLQFKVAVFDFDGTLTAFQYAEDRILPCDELDLKEYSKDNKKDYPKMNGKEFDKDKFKDFDKFDKKCPYYSKNSAIEELISLNGKIVTLIGKYNESKDTFYVCGMLEK